jgi:hypothetical protein
MPDRYYTLNLLDRARLPLALPLVRLIRPDLAMEDWRAFALPLVSEDDHDPPQRGIVVAERNGYMRGLFAYRAVPDLGNQPVLLVQNVAMFEIADSAALARVLRDEIASLSHKLRCARTQVLLDATDSWTRQQIADPARGIEVLCNA